MSRQIVKVIDKSTGQTLPSYSHGFIGKDMTNWPIGVYSNQEDFFWDGKELNRPPQGFGLVEDNKYIYETEKWYGQHPARQKIAYLEDKETKEKFTPVYQRTLSDPVPQEQMSSLPVGIYHLSGTGVAQFYWDGQNRHYEDYSYDNNRKYHWVTDQNSEWFSLPGVNSDSFNY